MKFCSNSSREREAERLMDLSGVTYLILFALIVAIPLIAIATEDTDARMSRGDFIRRALPAWFAAILVERGARHVARGLELEPALATMLVGSLIAGCLVHYFYRAVARRSLDATGRKKMADLVLIPLIGLFVLVGLCLLPSDNPRAGGPSSPLPAG
ncbi:MAG: hypothetical protein TEF_01105 [Rhizobiales bacterium NRL2]|nr:MAG: hypothetical protein TEF_01105 [Rhizobiales bacterium NRL2]